MAPSKCRCSSIFGIVEQARIGAFNQTSERRRPPLGDAFARQRVKKSCSSTVPRSSTDSTITAVGASTS